MQQGWAKWQTNVIQLDVFVNNNNNSVFIIVYKRNLPFLLLSFKFFFKYQVKQINNKFIKIYAQPFYVFKFKKYFYV